MPLLGAVLMELPWNLTSLGTAKLLEHTSDWNFLHFLVSVSLTTDLLVYLMRPKKKTRRKISLQISYIFIQFVL